MHQQRNPRLSRYNKKSKELFVDYINSANNRLLSPDQLQFGTPIELSPDGLTKVMVNFTSTLGWENTQEPLTYHRVNLSGLIRDGVITVHVDDYTIPDILKAIHEQWGILIEEDLVFMELVVRDLATATGNLLSGFSIQDGPDRELYPVPPSHENRNYILTFRPEHLIWFGTLKVQTRRSIRFLGKSIDSLMDLRQFYIDGNFNKPPVDLYQPSGELKLDDTKMDIKERRHYEAFLYAIKPEALDIGLPAYLTRLFSLLTGDEWVVNKDDPVDFNAAGIKVLYNGFASIENPVTDHIYNYVIAFQLSDLCSNLSGVLKIAYRYSNANTPGNLEYNRASPLPLFSR